MGAIRRSGRLENRHLFHIAVIERRFFDLNIAAVPNLPDDFGEQHFEPLALRRQR